MQSSLLNSKAASFFLFLRCPVPAYFGEICTLALRKKHEGLFSSWIWTQVSFVGNLDQQSGQNWKHWLFSPQARAGWIKHIMFQLENPPWTISMFIFQDFCRTFKSLELGRYKFVMSHMCISLTSHLFSTNLTVHFYITHGQTWLKPHLPCQIKCLSVLPRMLLKVSDFQQHI